MDMLVIGGCEMTLLVIAAGNLSHSKDGHLLVIGCVPEVRIMGVKAII